VEHVIASVFRDEAETVGSAAQMKLTIAASGEIDLELREEGTTAVRHAYGRARVR
jgi:hypothetical protein